MLLQNVFASLDTVEKVDVSWAKVAALKRTAISKTIFSSVKKESFDCEVKQFFSILELYPIENVSANA